MSGTLSIVATPIGNLGDLTFRALWNLKEADVVYSEDTRVISKLLTHYGLQKSLQRLDAATELTKAKEIVARLEAGEHIVYVSDAGTPGVSDPGARLVAYVREHAPEATIDAIPGPSALTAALSIAGIDTNEFMFLGFPPHKKGRQTFIKRVAAADMPVVLYESPHRIQKLLAELGSHKVARVYIGRELTKVHEELLVGTPEELAESLAKRKAERGEFVVIIENKK
ncbi:MAG: 16S rRNA (cytidine(1402)-2'-O)-methyltransferase [Candidatus Paceibacterota bacterium]